MISKDIKAFSKYLDIKPIEVIELYNPQIVEFENVDDFNIYYSTHKEEFDKIVISGMGYYTISDILNNKDKYDISSNFKLAEANIGTTNGINTIPLYMAFLIK